jgi:hypothetical protein
LQKTDPRMKLNCQSFCYGVLVILYFVLGSHFIIQWNIYVLCLFNYCFQIKRYLAFYFEKNILIKLEHAKLRLKVFWLQKWLDGMINNMRWPNKFWIHTWNGSTHHIAVFVICIMTCSGFGSYELMNHDSFKSK